jgi:uroporphyrinogen III methyltransferase/synthase
VTRAPEQAQELVRELERVGAEVIILPTVSFAPPADWKPLDSAIGALAGFDWILLTSQNAVRYFAQRCHELKLDPKSLQRPRPLVAAVGAATAKAATEAGFRVDYTAAKQTGESLVEELVVELWGSIGDRSVLLPRSDRADERLPRALQEAGARVTEVVAYRTAAPESLDAGIVDRVRRAEVDAIVFASPSAYDNLADVVGAESLAELSARMEFAAIGPTTARALREGGARVAIESNEPSAAGLADSIAKYYQRQVAESKDSGAKDAMTGRQ